VSSTNNDNASSRSINCGDPIIDSVDQNTNNHQASLTSPRGGASANIGPYLLYAAKKFELDKHQTHDNGNSDAKALLGQRSNTTSTGRQSQPHLRIIVPSNKYHVSEQIQQHDSRDDNPLCVKEEETDYEGVEEDEEAECELHFIFV